MSHYEKTERAMTGNKTYKKEQTVEDVQRFELCDGVPSRGISKATCHHFEMREERDGVGMPIAHYLPVTYRGSVTGYIKRTINLPKSRAWSVVGTVTDDCELLGTTQSKQDGTRTLLVVEGMYDLLAAYQMVMQHTERQYKGNINVVSLVLGTKNAVRNCVHNEEFINKHKNILLCFDNDMVSSEEKKKDPSMMRGREATQAVGIRFKNAERIPLTLNDPCEYSKADKSREFYNLVAFNKTPIEFAFINRGVKISAEELLKESEPGIETGVFPKLDKLLGGFRKHEFTILLGPAKSGKTTVAREIAYSFLKNTDEVVCYASLEDTRSQLASSFVALDHSVAPSEFMLDKTLISQSKVQSTLDTVLSEERFILIDSESGDISPKEIVVLLRKAVDMGATLFIYDHLSFSVDSGSAKGNKKDIIDALLTEMSNLVKEHPISIIGIAHITHEKGRGEVRDRDTGETKYPYFYSVGRYDGAGSSGYAKLCDNLLLIDQQFIGNEEIGLRRLKLALNRRTKSTGIADYFSMLPNGRLDLEDFQN